MATELQYLTDTLAFLCREPRKAGSPRNAAIAKHLCGQYQSLGYAAGVQSFGFTGWNLITPPRVEYLTPVVREIVGCLPVVWSGSTAGDVTGEVRLHAPGVPATIRTYESYEWHVLPVIAESGAVVASLLSNATVWPQPRDGPHDRTPCIMVPPEEYAFIAESLRAGGRVTVRLSVASEYVDHQIGRNVVAFGKKGDWTFPSLRSSLDIRGAAEVQSPFFPNAQSRPKVSVIIGAHYDSFFTTTGAHDNASGTAALLCLARRLAASPRPVPAIGYVAFDAEEWNKLGSYRFTEQLEQSGDLRHLRMMINIDSVADGDGIYLLVAPQLQRSLTKALHAARIAIGTEACRSYFTRPLSIMPAQDLQAFDAWPFLKRGIPSMQIGTFGAAPFRHWHTPSDALALIGAAEQELILDVASLVEDLLTYWPSPE